MLESTSSGSENRTIDQVAIRSIVVSSMKNNVYLLSSLQDGAQLLIDAADSPKKVLALLQPIIDERLKIITTHSHSDHHEALSAVVRATGAQTLAGRQDCAEMPVPIDRPLDHGDTVTFGGITLEIIGLRGHTPGSIAIVYRESLTSADEPGRVHIFSGDSLFPGGVGKTSSPADFASLLGDVKTRIFDQFADNTLIYPGHGATTTLGAERPYLAEWERRGW